MSIIPKQLLPAAIVAAVSVTNSYTKVNFTSWGGDYEISQQKAYFNTWNKGTVKFLKYGGGLDEVRTQVNSSSATLDIVDVLPHDARVGCDEDLFEELDREMFKPASDGTAMDDDIMVEVPNDCVVPQAFWSCLFFYKEAAFKGNQPRV